jgi:hypothetical protein
MGANTKIGDVFSVKINDDSKKYFQYVVSDLTQLNSDVIRAFKQVYPLNANPNLPEIVNGEVEFYAHCITKLGLKMKVWEKVGNIVDVGKINHILFRDSGDYGNPQVKISQDWWVWKINEEQRRVGKLEGENRKSYIGIVINPLGIIDLLNGGKYPINYPEFE